MIGMVTSILKGTKPFMLSVFLLTEGSRNDLFIQIYLKVLRDHFFEADAVVLKYFDYCAKIYPTNC